MGGVKSLSQYQRGVYDALEKECLATAATAADSAKSSFTLAGKTNEYPNVSFCKLGAFAYAKKLPVVAPVENYDKYLTADVPLTVVVDEKNSRATAFFGDISSQEGLRFFLLINGGDIKADSCSLANGNGRLVGVDGFQELSKKASERLGDVSAALRTLALAEKSYSSSYTAPKDGVLFSIVDSFTEMSTRETDTLTGETHMLDIREDDDGTTKTIKITDRQMKDESELKKSEYNVVVSKSVPRGAPKSTFTNDPSIEDVLIKTGNMTIFIVDHKRAMPKRMKED